MAGLILPHRGIMPKIAEDAFIAETAVVIGDVEIGSGSSIWYGCVLRGDVNSIRIGRETNLQDGTIVHVNRDPAGDYRETGGGMPTVVGDRVTVGHLALLHACTVEDEGFVGMRAVVMDQAVVGARSMLAAGALLSPRKQMPSGQLWAGSPARHTRDLTGKELDFIPCSAANYARLAAEHRGRQAG